jgi:hypothetical protein
VFGVAYRMPGLGRSARSAFGSWLLVILLALLLLFKRRNIFPHVTMILFVAGVLLQAGDLLIAHVPSGVDVPSTDISKLVGAAWGTIIWSAYLLKSARLRSTFVRRYRLSRPPPFSSNRPALKADHAVP